MNDLDDDLGGPPGRHLGGRIASHLTAQADQLAYANTGLDRVIARGRRRQRRARATAAACLAVCLAGSVGAYQATRVHDSGRQKVTVGADPSTASNEAATTLAPSTTMVGPLGVVPAGPAGSSAASSSLPQATLGGTALTWTRKEPKSSLMNANYLSGRSGPLAVGDGLIALSTAPGLAKNGEFGGRADTLYRTTDGVEWSPSKAPSWISQLAGGGDRIYAVGTAPADVATRLGVTEGAAIVGSSTDGGSTWKQVALPPGDGTSGPKGTRSHPISLSLAAGASGVVVSEFSSRFAYVSDLVPSGVDTSWGVTTSPAGVSVLGRPPAGEPDASVCPSGQQLIAAGDVPAQYAAPSGELFAANGLSTWGCALRSGGNVVEVTPLRFDQLGYPVARTYTWDDLGTTWQKLTSSGALSTRWLSSPDGTAFAPVEVPWAAEAAFSPQPPNVVAMGDEFLAFVPTPASGGEQANGVLSVQQYRSTDGGRTWEAGARSAAVDPFGMRPARLDDGRWVIADYSRGGDGPVVRTSPDAVAWQEIGLDQVVRSALGPTERGAPDAFTVGPRGMAFALFVSTDSVAAGGGVQVKRNGVTLTLRDQSGRFTVSDDASGAELGTGRLWGGAEQLTGSLRLVGGDGGAATTTAVGPAPCADCGVRSVPQAPIYVVVDPASGDERARFDAQIVSDAMNKGANVYEPPHAKLISSSDGVAWTVTDLSEVAGEPITMVAGIDWLGDKLVVRAQTARRIPDIAGNSSNAFVQLALVGTPA